MALAALGDDSLLDRSLFDAIDNRLVAVGAVDPADPIGMAGRALAALGIRDIGPRGRRESLHQQHANIAQLIQESFYTSLRWRLSRLVETTGIRDVCFAGGVALNCVAVGRLVEEGVVDSVFVQPAAGDNGQCLGAAYIAMARMGLERPSKRTFSPFLGRDYGDDLNDAMEIIERSRVVVDGYGPDVGIHSALARLLAAGNMAIWYEGRSEFGPRALRRTQYPRAY